MENLIIGVRNDPTQFAKRLLRFTPTPQQQEIFNAVAQGNRVAVRTGKGVGRTTAFAVIILWWMARHWSALIVCTAHKEDQLREQLWAEINLRLSGARPEVRAMYNITSTVVQATANPEGNRCLAQVARRDANAGEVGMQGWHHDNLLCIADEASGIQRTFLEAIEGTLTGDANKFIVGGNPNLASGYLYDCFNKHGRFWSKVHCNARQSPIVSKTRIFELEAKYGPQSNIVRVQVDGDFPLADHDSLIALNIVESAAERIDKSTITDKVVIGLDPGRSVEGDASALVARRGTSVIASEQMWVRDGMEVAGRARLFRDGLCPDPATFSHFAVDTIGLGGPIHDRLKELGERSIEVNVALPASEPKGTRASGKAAPANLRAELWLACRDWLQFGSITNANNLEELKSELTGPRYKINSKGEIVIESKEDIKRRGLSSPNLADALCLTLAPDDGGGVWTAWV